jgi:8-oxo-dGTP diphosphatase
MRFAPFSSRPRTGRRPGRSAEHRLVIRVLSSPATRCLQTVEPLAAERRLEIEPIEALAVDGGVQTVLRMLIDRTYEAAVMCTHGEVIGEVLQRGSEAGLRLLDPP